MTNVKNLTEEELERGLIWLYPPKGKGWEDQFGEISRGSFEDYELYCMDWNTLIPLVIKNELDIQPPHVSKEWFVSTKDDCTIISNVNLERAVMEMLLIIGERGNENQQ